MIILLPYQCISSLLCSTFNALSQTNGWAWQNHQLKIRTISYHRRIRHRSNARATTPSSAYMQADVALLKLHCRPNDLDCCLEALADSQSLYRLYMLGVNLCYCTRCPILWVARLKKKINKNGNNSFILSQKWAKFKLLALNYAVKQNNKLMFLSKFKMLQELKLEQLLQKCVLFFWLFLKWKAAIAGWLRDSRHIPEFLLTIAAASHFPGFMDEEIKTFWPGCPAK